MNNKQLIKLWVEQGYIAYADFPNGTYELLKDQSAVDSFLSKYGSVKLVKSEQSIDRYLVPPDEEQDMIYRWEK